MTSDFRFSPHLIDPGAPQQPLPKTKVFDFFPGSVDMGRVGVRVRVIGLGLELVSRAVFWAFFEISLVNTGTTRAPHQIPRFLYFILDNNPYMRSRRLGAPH